MKIPDVEPLSKDPELLDYLDYNSLILNRGRYEMRVIGEVPSWDANEGETVLYAAGNERAMYAYINGQWVSVAWGGGGTTMNAIFDTDQDTIVQVEKNTDEDIIRFDCAGSEQFYIQDGAIIPTVDNDINLGTIEFQFKNIYIDSMAYIDGLGESMLVAGTNQIQFYDTDIYISSKTDGHLDLDADTYINANGPTHIVSNNLYLDSNQQLHFEGIAGDNYMKWNSTEEYMELYVQGTLRVQF